MKKNYTVIVLCTLLVVFAVTIYNKSIPNQIAAAEKTHTQSITPRVAVVADPNQSMEGTYCDRLAAVGASVVDGRNKGTRRSTVEAVITNTQEITESERIMYRQMTKAVYNEPSLTKAQMSERTHKACEDRIAEATTNKRGVVN
jgi:hypothetical protein